MFTVSFLGKLLEGITFTHQRKQECGNKIIYVLLS